MAAYGKAAQSKVEKTMRERKQGTLRSGSGKKVTSRKQAIAIGLSEAREAGAKVPEQKWKESRSARQRAAIFYDARRPTASGARASGAVSGSDATSGAGGAASSTRAPNTISVSHATSTPV